MFTRRQKSDVNRRTLYICGSDVKAVCLRCIFVACIGSIRFLINAFVSAVSAAFFFTRVYCVRILVLLSARYNFLHAKGPQRVFVNMRAKQWRAGCVLICGRWLYFIYSKFIGYASWLLCAFIFDSHFLMLLVALYMRRQHMRFSAIYEPRLHERILFVYIYFFGLDSLVARHLWIAEKWLVRVWCRRL